ncbi:MAG: hypothetical protein RRY97_08130 [Oscillibacter sp.]
METTEKRAAAPAAEMVGNRADGDSRCQEALAGTTAGEAAAHCGEPVLGKADAGRADVGRADAGKADGGRADAGRADGGKADAGRADGGRADGDSRCQGDLAGTAAGEGAAHCGEPVSGNINAGKADGGKGDAGRADAGTADAGTAGPVSPVNRRGVKGKPATPTVRRVGTFTFGAMMVAVGVAMLISMFFPGLDMTLALQLSPLILVSLGIEVLLSARGDGRVRYDWVGMLLSCIIVCAALALFFAAWYAVHYPNQFIYW